MPDDYREFTSKPSLFKLMDGFGVVDLKIEHPFFRSLSLEKFQRKLTDIHAFKVGDIIKYSGLDYHIKEVAVLDEKELNIPYTTCIVVISDWPVIQVHDEIMFDVTRDQLQAALKGMDLSKYRIDLKDLGKLVDWGKKP